MYLLSLSFWKYLLTKKSKDVGWLTVLVCRWRGHPLGPIWYTSTGVEPDMRCRNCLDDIG